MPDLPPVLLTPLKNCAADAPDVLPDDYGDPDGLWATVRCPNPFDVLLLERNADVTPDTILVRFRVLWKFWTQKLAVARQGATRLAIRKKYGEDIESYIDNLQWAYDQLSAEGGIEFWRAKLTQARSQTLWSRMGEVVDATLADGLLEASEVTHLISRAEFAGYDREEFALALRDVLHARRFEPEVAPSGETSSEKLASVRWATSEVWSRMRGSAVVPAMPRFYLRARQTGAVFGPVTAEGVAEVVHANGITAADDVCLVGASVWQPIVQSQFGHFFRTQVATTYGYSCPRCAQSLICVVEASNAGWIVFVIGLLTSFLYVGIPLVIIGIVMLLTRTRTQRWRCMQCGYAS